MAAPKCLLLFALLCAAALGGRDAARPPKPPLPPSPPPRVINNCPSCTRSMLLLGDSFSDGGLPYGLWSLDNSTYPYAQYGDVSAYYQGRFSNGLAWFDIMQTAFNISTAINLAVGGATVNEFPNRTAPSTLASQLQAALAYLSNTSNTFSQPSLGIISIGAQDVIELVQDLLSDNNTDVNTSADTIVNATIAAAQQLLLAGVDNIAVVPTFTWLFQTPLIRALRVADSGVAGQFVALVNRLNGRLATAAGRLANATNATVAYVDVAPELNRIVVSPQKYVLKNVTLPCLVFDPVGTGSTVMDFNGTSFEPATLVSACNRPQDFLFWDIIHPTVVGHRLISKFIAGELRKWQLLSGTTVVA